MTTFCRSELHTCFRISEYYLDPTPLRFCLNDLVQYQLYSTIDAIIEKGSHLIAVLVLVLIRPYPVSKTY
jgi:hypothetical protein